MSSGPAMKSVREDSLAGEKDEGSWLSVLTPSPKFPTYNKKKTKRFLKGRGWKENAFRFRQQELGVMWWGGGVCPWDSAHGPVVQSKRQRFESCAEVKPRSGPPGKCGKGSRASKEHQHQKLGGVKMSSKDRTRTSR